jgi:hypothetical protein
VIASEKAFQMANGTLKQDSRRKTNEKQETKMVQTWWLIAEG